MGISVRADDMGFYLGSGHQRVLSFNLRLSLLKTASLSFHFYLMMSVTLTKYRIWVQKAPPHLKLLFL